MFLFPLHVLHPSSSYIPIYSFTFLLFLFLALSSIFFISFPLFFSYTSALRPMTLFPIHLSSFEGRKAETKSTFRVLPTMSILAQATNTTYATVAVWYDNTSVS